jgi:hypothetical protein
LSVDTYLVVPVESPGRAARLLSAGGDDVTHVGRDYVVLFKGDLFAGVERAPDTWGPRYAEELPPSVRRRLDPRGLLARPEVGQAFAFETYAEAVDAEGPSLWLPVRRVRRKRRKRLLLVALSPEREAMLFEHPELVRDLISSRSTVSIPGAVEFDETWIDLQRLLLDCLWLELSDDARADALAPRSGLSFLEDETVDAARLIRADQARATAEWLATLTPERVDRATREPPGPASRRFPESLGAAPADDSEPIRRTVRNKPAKVSSETLNRELQKLLSFYEAVGRLGRSVLSVRFRE